MMLKVYIYKKKKVVLKKLNVLSRTINGIGVQRIAHRAITDVKQYRAANKEVL